MMKTAGKATRTEEKGRKIMVPKVVMASRYRCMVTPVRAARYIQAKE